MSDITFTPSSANGTHTVRCDVTPNTSLLDISQVRKINWVGGFKNLDISVDGMIPCTVLEEDGSPFSSLMNYINAYGFPTRDIGFDFRDGDSGIYGLQFNFQTISADAHEDVVWITNAASATSSGNDSELIPAQQMQNEEDEYGNTTPRFVCLIQTISVPVGGWVKITVKFDRWLDHQSTFDKSVTSTITLTKVS